MPLNIPPTSIPAVRFNQNYSLPQSKRGVEPLQSQVAAFSSWVSKDYQLDRPGGAVALSTLNNLLIKVFLYLGFLHLHMGVSGPTLLEFLDPQQYIAFISFQIAKGRSIVSLTQIISHSKKVLMYLSSSNGGAQLAAKIAAHQFWLNTLRKQLVFNIPKRKRCIGELEDNNKWVDCTQLVSLIHIFCGKTVKCVLEVEGEICLSLARVLHNAALASVMFSHLPPIRLVCWRTLQMHDTAGCLKSDCHKPGCKGNRLHREAGALTLILSHYKTDRK
jgi:hypothetical protein